MRAKLTATILLLVFVMVFAVQNAETVQIRMLFWEVEFPRSLLIFMMLLIGMLIGWFSRSMWRITRTGD